MATSPKPIRWPPGIDSRRRQFAALIAFMLVGVLAASSGRVPSLIKSVAGLTVLGAAPVYLVYWARQFARESDWFATGTDD